MGGTSSAVVDTTSDREMVVTRVFDAPRELVFSAWTTPEHLHRWWGPRGFTTTTHAFRFAPGGEWKLTMHGPDGVDYPNRIVYDEIEPPSRIAYARDDESHAFRTTVTFANEGKKSRVVMRATFATKAERDEVIAKYHADEGGKQTLERLGESVANLRFYVDPARPRVEMTRLLDAPPRLVFEAMTKAEHLARWWGPRGTKLEIFAYDLRPGGAYRFVLVDRSGGKHPFKGVFREISPNERLVLTMTYDVKPYDQYESVVSTRLEEVNGKTLCHVVESFSTMEERDGKVASGMRNGAEQSHDRLEELLAALTAS